MCEYMMRLPMLGRGEIEGELSAELIVLEK